MSGHDSKNPDYLLSLIKKDESRLKQGKLKIFLGMAAGVGKTFAMLQSAQQLKQSGLDVVVGLVETHGRKETASLLNGLELLPRTRREYKGVIIEEMDLDTILVRKPKVVLVDELAHTNAVGSRHSKRYLDVLEILEAGIDVYSTLNVQHIESRVDTVQDITQITVHETVPDNVLDRADEVVLIDLPPEELLKRLSDGRIYAEASATLAAKNFFKRGNLTALREIALRVAAERVDRELREYKTLNGIEGVWKAGGRLMVAIFASPYAEILIRWTRRVSDLLGVTWIGAYVESDEGYSEDEKKLLARNIALVQQLGGEVISTRDDDPVKGLLRIAQQNNVTQIIVGKSQRSLLKTIFSGGSIVNRLLRQSGNIDIYAVSTNRSQGRRHLKDLLRFKKPSFQANDAGLLIAIILGTWGFSAALKDLIGYRAVGIIFLIAVSVAGVFLSRAAVVMLAFAFAAIHNFFFIPPLFTLSITNPEDFMLVLMYFVAAAVIGHLTTRLSQKERILRSREDRTTLLYNLAKEIAASSNVKDMIASAQETLETALGFTISIVLNDSKTSGTLSGLKVSDKEKAVAQWAFSNEKMAGRGTETLSASQGTYIPMRGRSGILGVVGVMLDSETAALNTDQLALIDAFNHQIASGIERETYHDKVKSLLVVEQTQKLYKSLLDCVSHELKTPLSAIKGSASALVDPITSANSIAVQDLGGQILDASDRLHRLVENLLDMTRIESGMMQPRRETTDIGDIISTALLDLGKTRGSREILISLPSADSTVMCDPVLTNQALSNILHNVFMYTPDSTMLEITATVEHTTASIAIRDHGPGLPIENPERVLEKFYRGDPTKAGGVGLGLSIAKGFIEAQGGTVHAQNHPEGGALFTIRLPKGNTL